MQPYSRDDLITLAQAYIAFTGYTPTRLGREMTGNDKLFKRLFSGGDCTLTSAALAWEWLVKNWPPYLEWPAGVMKPPGIRTQHPNSVAAARRARIAAEEAA
jgi:hypothetical protein